ncbi:MAG: sle [Frankiales bacterium]|nr:sle [Frankiales bacterium]
MTYPTTGNDARTSTSTPLPTGMNPSEQRPRVARRLSTETKSAFKTTELLAYLGTVVAILIAAQTIGDDSTAGKGGDYFRADTAFLYITIVTVGYLISRGLAKSGSRDFYNDDQH